MTEQFNTAMKNKALEQLRQGKSLLGKDGAFTPLLKQFLEQALEAEMEDHLDQEARQEGNKRNGKKNKQIKSDAGAFGIDTPQDRQSTFEPQIVRKRETLLANSLQDKIIGLYGLGMSYRDIAKHIEEMYDMKVSPMVLSQITDRIIPDIKVWQNRLLGSVYPMVWLDAIHYKVKDEGQMQSKALYSILGINCSGKKEVLGVYLAESEGARYWLNVLTELQNRGVRDILIACTDNLKGFAEAIHAVYPKTEIQNCIVHQIRNSLKYVTSKDQKVFMKDLKQVYQASTKELAEQALSDLAKTWQQKYPIVIRSWEDNWEHLSSYFAYAPPIRKLIYTTNTIEGYHRQLRKVTKTKGAFTSDMALLKIVYLATRNIEKNWNRPIHNWSLTVQQLFIKFGDRMKLTLNLKSTS